VVDSVTDDSYDSVEACGGGGGRDDVTSGRTMRNLHRLADHANVIKAGCEVNATRQPMQVQ